MNNYWEDFLKRITIFQTRDTRMSNKHFKIVVKEAKKNESKSDGERAVDDYDTLIDGLKELGFEPSSNVRNGKIYPYRTRFTATKDGIKYGFTLNEDRTGEYLESIEVVGGSIYTGDPKDKDARVFKSVGEVLDALKQVDGKKSEASRNIRYDVPISSTTYASELESLVSKLKTLGISVKPQIYAEEDSTNGYAEYKLFGANSSDDIVVIVDISENHYTRITAITNRGKLVMEGYGQTFDEALSALNIVEESKKSESLSLKQKELKDMARYGEAEDITTISDAEAKELRKKGIETVGVSRGTYGMNGALLRDKDGNKYVITARSSNLFYFV